MITIPHVLSLHLRAVAPIQRHRMHDGVASGETRELLGPEPVREPAQAARRRAAA
jgi:hypothetical protein